MTSNAEAWASASRIRTPGMTGWPGKWPAKNGSPMVTDFHATRRLPFSCSTTRSISRKGGWCGRIRWIASTSSTVFRPAACPAPPCSLMSPSPLPRAARPAPCAASPAPCASRAGDSARPRSCATGRPVCRRAAHLLPGPQVASYPGLGGDARAVADGEVPDDPGLAGHHHPHAQPGRSGDAHLRDAAARAARPRRCGRSAPGCRSWCPRPIRVTPSGGPVDAACRRRSRRRPPPPRSPPAGACSGAGRGPRPRDRRRTRSRPSR